jgi:hypothetical protein
VPGLCAKRIRCQGFRYQCSRRKGLMQHLFRRLPRQPSDASRLFLHPWHARHAANEAPLKFVAPAIRTRRTHPRQYSISAGGTGNFGTSLGNSATTASVVRIKPATEAAF